VKKVYLLQEYDDFPELLVVAMTKEKVKIYAEELCGYPLVWEGNKLTRGKNERILYEVIKVDLYE
jgi:hypothetical protein